MPVRWAFQGPSPDGATACNCTACRRYGTLWAYDYEGEGDQGVRGRTSGLRPRHEPRVPFLPDLRLHGLLAGKGLDAQVRRRIAVNLRLAEPEAVGAIPIDHFDGLAKLDDLPRDGRCVADMWF